MNQAPSHSDIIRARAQQMVATGQAPNFRKACSILGKHAAKARNARKRREQNRQRAQTMWWNK
jgi:hypothetical protein